MSRYNKADQGKRGDLDKIIQRNKPLKQVSHFRYLVCDNHVEHDRNHVNKIDTKPRVLQRRLKTKLYGTHKSACTILTPPVGTYGCETCTFTKLKKTKTPNIGR